MKFFLSSSLTFTVICFNSVVFTAGSRPHNSKNKDVKSRPNYDFIDYYDCSGKENGNYIHPTDCTRFIICSNTHASDMACPDCDLPNSQCLGQPYLIWDAAKDRCEWPEGTECVTDPGSGISTTTTTTRSTTTTTTTKSTTTTTPTTTTEKPADPTTPEPDPPTTCQELAKEGDPCDKNDCQPCGYCWELHSFFLRCSRTFPSDPKLPITGVWVHEACDNDLWWNPDLRPTLGEDEQEEGWGGACDHWDNLSEETKAGYNQDENCVKPVKVCEWGQDEKDTCSGRYWYFDPNTMTDRENMSCTGDLIWDQGSETCRECQHVEGCSC